MSYGFRNGSVYQGIKAEAAGAELERIRKANGGKLQTRDVVQAARSKYSPLHSAFTWDDGDAAEAYRLMEARWLIREVVVVTEETQNQRPAFVHVRIAGNDEEETAERYYQSSSVIVENETEFEAAVAESTSRLISSRASLDELRQLSKGNRKQLRLIDTALAHVTEAKAVVARLQ